jgi:hypothetical protein
LTTVRARSLLHELEQERDGDRSQRNRQEDQARDDQGGQRHDTGGPSGRASADVSKMPPELMPTPCLSEKRGRMPDAA